MKEEIYIKTNLKYQPTQNDFIYFPRFWVSYDGKITEMYTGSLEGGGYYYELDGDYRKEIKKIVYLLGEKSTRALIDFYKKNNGKRFG